MNRLAHWMMRLYPARWRRRYGDELGVLLADTGADARVVADLFRGGMRMQFRTWSFAKLAVVLGIGGLLLGAASSYLIAPMYVSQAMVQVEPMGDVMQQVEPILLSWSSLSGIINDPLSQVYSKVYEHELQIMPVESVLDKMRNDIRIDPVESPGDHGKPSSAFTIAFGYRDPATARQIVAALVDRFDQISRQLQGTRPRGAGKRILDVVDTASLSVWAVYPMGRRFVQVGFPAMQRLFLLAGLIAGFVVALIWRRIRRTGFVARRFRLAAILFSLLGAIAGFAVTAVDVIGSGDDVPTLFGEQYRSSALLSFRNTTPEEFAALRRDVLSRTSLARVIDDPRIRLYQTELKTEPLEDIVRNMLRHLAITPDASGHYFTVSFVYPDRYKAKQTVEAIIDRFDELTRKMQAGPTVSSATPMEWGQPIVLTQPSTPILPISPNRYRLAGQGGIAGLVVAAVIAMIRRRWKPEAEIPMDAVNEQA